MVKSLKFVLDVLPLLKLGRYSVLLDGEVYTGSRQYIFGLVGNSCVALQLLIPFDFV